MSASMRFPTALRPSWLRPSPCAQTSNSPGITAPQMQMRPTRVFLLRARGRWRQEGGGGFDSPIPNPPAPPLTRSHLPRSLQWRLSHRIGPCHVHRSGHGGDPGTPTAQASTPSGFVFLNTETGCCSAPPCAISSSTSLCDPNINRWSHNKRRTIVHRRDHDLLTRHRQHELRLGLWRARVTSATNLSPPHLAGARDYWVTLIVNPGWPCADTSEVLYQVWQPLNPEIVVTGFAMKRKTRTSTLT